MSDIKTILLVEDDEDIVSCLKELLELQGYRVLVALDGEEGVNLYTENRERVSLVVTDLNLPKMDGDEVIRTINEMNPEQRFILVSGYIADDKLIKLYEGRLTFLQKPYRFQTIIELVREQTT
ncbi:MAG: response regulator [Candidatus Cloacimonas sp.]|nr:response regulator [Candidatus Cloacimonadota bacterium]